MPSRGSSHRRRLVTVYTVDPDEPVVNLFICGCCCDAVEVGVHLFLGFAGAVGSVGGVGDAEFAFGGFGGPAMMAMVAVVVVVVMVVRERIMREWRVWSFFYLSGCITTFMVLEVSMRGFYPSITTG